MRTLQSQILWSIRAQKALGVIALLLVAGFYFAGYRPQTRKLSTLQADTRRAERELADNQQKAAAKNEIAASNENLKHELNLIKKPSRSDDMPEIVKELTAAQDRNGLKKFDRAPALPRVTELFLEAPQTVTFESDFMNVFNFLRTIEDMPRLTRLRYLKLKSTGKAGTVHATVVMNFYYAAEEPGVNR